MDREISSQEIINATKKLKNNKATANDAICNEMLKCIAGTHFICILTKVFNTILVHSLSFLVESRVHCTKNTHIPAAAHKHPTIAR